jgi:hypothetical protein
MKPTYRIDLDPETGIHCLITVIGDTEIRRVCRSEAELRIAEAQARVKKARK